MTLRARVLSIALCAALTGCGTLRPIWAPSADLDDYRHFRVADDPGVRLARGYVYLARHPRGAWSEELRAIVEVEEPAYFVRAQSSRAALIDYLTNLPSGPHAEQAISLVAAYDRGLEEAESDRMLREARLTEATLEKASAARKRVGERVLGGLAVLLDPKLVGTRSDAVPPETRRFFEGPAASTWGALSPSLEEDLFFLLPTRPERTSRLLTLVTELVVEDGVVIGARMRGDDLLVKWYEASRIVALDPSRPEDRTEAMTASLEVLAGAAEQAFPASRCAAPSAGRELLVRQCDGRSLRVVVGEKAGDADTVEVGIAAPKASSKPAEVR